MEAIVEETLKQVESRIDVLQSWQQDAINRLIKEAIELAYKQGRVDQRYISEGPTRAINLYR